MKKLLILTVATVVCFVLTMANSRADEATDPLQGVWEAKSAEKGGKQAPPEFVKNLRFTFKGDKVLIRGNFGDEREEECTYTVDDKKSPKQIDVILPIIEKNQKVLGIYEIKGDELKLCLRHLNHTNKGRPTELATKEGSDSLLMVFKKAPADKK